MSIENTQWQEIAHAQGLDPILLYAVALARTGVPSARRLAQPWPWTLVVDGARRRYETKDAAARAWATIDPERRTQVELGLTGLAPTRWGHRLASGESAHLLDPRQNLSLAATILADSLRTTPTDLVLAVGHFAHPDETAARAFGARVIAIAAALGMPTVSLPARNDRRSATRYARYAPTARVPSLIAAAARRHGVDPAYALAVAYTESNFRPEAISRAGALGVMQLMPKTAARYGADPDHLSVEANIDIGVQHLRDLAVDFGGDPRLVAAAYNAGKGAVLRHHGQIPPYSGSQPAGGALDRRGSGAWNREVNR